LRLGIQVLLSVRIVGSEQQPFIGRYIKVGAEPARQHGGLIEPPLAQTPVGHRYGYQRIGAGQVVVEAMLQRLGEKFAEQVTIRPFRVVFETGNQAVDRETVSPGCDHLFKSGRPVQALAAIEARRRHGQGTGLAVIAEPGQLGFAADADGRGAIGGFITEQAGLFVF
jgi:hypothetical protein